MNTNSTPRVEKTVYRGYHICWDTKTGGMWVERNGMTVQGVSSAQDAREVIDAHADHA